MAEPCAHIGLRLLFLCHKVAAWYALGKFPRTLGHGVEVADEDGRRQA